MDVNPRIPKVNKRGILTGVVVGAIKRTLVEESESFVMKNQGMYLLSENVEFEKAIAILNHFLGRIVRVNLGKIKFLTVSKKLK